MHGCSERLAVGRASKPRDVFFGWRSGIRIEVPARLGDCHSTISSLVEFAELLATIWCDFRRSRAEPGKPAIRRSDVIFGASFYLARSCDDRQTPARCWRTYLASRLVFCADREPGIFSGPEPQTLSKRNAIRRGRALACTKFS